MVVTLVSVSLMSTVRRPPDAPRVVSEKRCAKESVLPCTAKKKLSIIFRKITLWLHFLVV